MSAPKKCEKCGQFIDDVFMSGEQPCTACGIPTLWDDITREINEWVERYGSVWDALNVAIAKVNYLEAQIKDKDAQQYMSDEEYQAVLHKQLTQE